MATNVTVKQRAGESSERMIKRFLKQVKSFELPNRWDELLSEKVRHQRLKKQKARREMDKKNAKKKAAEKYVWAIITLTSRVSCTNTSHLADLD